MTVTILPEIEHFHTCSDQMQTSVLDTLFEPSPAIHATLLPVIRTAEYSTWDDLIDVCQIRLLSLASSNSLATPSTRPSPTLLSILGSHPRLGEKKIESEHSKAEQASVQNGADSEQEEELDRLNQLYEETFPGLRARIERGDYTKEVDAALQAMCDIAKSRAAKM
ncbi:hypothetical protein N3K66_009027 [Trichothecium roseum]|uniref:Uncharacterized protein n=1 Tax=Trichothecium roseum TaxID=47278 RepID=A0ACC0URI7_9HYPO|nr:hypothetical protein N3K66_009027 [Trichothecium roseum]